VLAFLGVVECALRGAVLKWVCLVVSGFGFRVKRSWFGGVISF
jgi:hypothetical protein